MKQAYPVLKNPIFLLLLFVASDAISAQNCYQPFLQKGIQAFESFQFEKAIKNFEAAKVCTDRPESTEAEEWLTKAQNGYIDRLQLIASRYLTSEGQRAYQRKDYPMAFRLYQEALKYKNDNKQAKELQRQMLSYLPDYQYNATIDPRFYHPEKAMLEKENLIVVLDENNENKTTQTNLVDSDSGELKHEFEIKGILSNFQFSSDGEWLVTEFFDVEKDMVMLSLWDVASKEIVHTIENIYRSEAYNAFAFSENCEKLVYRIEAPIMRIISSSDEGEVTTDTLWEPAFALNVYDLVSKKTIYSTSSIVDFFSDSPEARFSPFRREAVWQDLLNEKIEMKFSTKGVIATNNRNFILKEDAFRIRTDYDFSISPDGKKFAFLKYIEGSSYYNFSSLTNSFGSKIKEPEPPILTGKIDVIDLENADTIFTSKSEHKELPQRFLPFSFSKKSDHFVFIDKRKWSSWGYNKETNSMESTKTVFQNGFNIFDFQKDTFLIQNYSHIHDYYLTENNQVLAWAGHEMFVGFSGNIKIFDLETDNLVFDKHWINDFSHFYDIKTKDGSYYFTTLDSDKHSSMIYKIELEEDTITSVDFDFANFSYTYLRASKDNSKIAFLTDNGKKINVWDALSKNQIREIKCQSQIAEFDFSNDAKFLIIRDEHNLVKIIDLRVTDELYKYFDKNLEQLTEQDKKQIGIDW